MDWEEIKIELKKIIFKHGLKSTQMGGFSCYVPDGDVNGEGFLLWNCSERYKRIEIQIQKFHAMARVNKMATLGINSNQYKAMMLEAVPKFISEFKSFAGASEIGSGVKFFEEISLSNYAISEFTLKKPNVLEKLDNFTINNSIVKKLIEIGYLKNLK